MNKIMNTIKNHKKLAIALLLLITVSVIGTVIVLNKPKTIEQPKVAETKQEVKDEKKTSTKEDKKSDDKKKDDKKSDDKKKDDKKSDEKKKTDVKPEATATPSNDATVEETQNTTSNNVSNNTSITNNNTTSNSTSNNPAPTPCVPTYTTVTHPAVGHYEQREIMPAYDKPIYAEKIVGGHTGRVYNTLAEFASQDEDGNYSLQQVQVGTEHVPAVYDNVWVEDQPAYTTTEASGC